MSRPSAFGPLKVDPKLILGWRLHEQVGWLLALEDAVDIAQHQLDQRATLARFRPLPSAPKMPWLSGLEIRTGELGRGQEHAPPLVQLERK